MKLIGKQKQKDYFDGLIKNGTLGQFYIIEGASGVGRRVLVEYISMKIHCESAAAPCFKCPACIKHMTGNHPDYIKVKNADGDKKNVTVDTIRGVAADIFVKPMISDTKIYVLDDEKPIGTEGQNAFLKILEEPPSYAVIFLIVKDKSELLETVLSRGVLCHVSPCTKSETVEFIKENFPQNAHLAEFIADYSAGVLGVAEKMASEGEFFQLREDFYSVLKAVSHSKAQGICETIKFFVKNKDKCDILLNLFVSWLRDVYVLKTLKEGSVINYDYKNDIYTFASCVSEAEVMDTISAIFNMAENFSKGNNTELWICDVLSHLY